MLTEQDKIFISTAPLEDLYDELDYAEATDSEYHRALLTEIRKRELVILAGE